MKQTIIKSMVFLVVIIPAMYYWIWVHSVCSCWYDSLLRNQYCYTELKTIIEDYKIKNWEYPIYNFNNEGSIYVANKKGDHKYLLREYKWGNPNIEWTFYKPSVNKKSYILKWYFEWEIVLLWIIPIKRVIKEFTP